MTEQRFCMFCGKSLEKRRFERPSQFDRRHTCNRSCAGKLARDVMGEVEISDEPSEAEKAGQARRKAECRAKHFQGLVFAGED